jgi:hypothetical protein
MWNAIQFKVCSVGLSGVGRINHFYKDTHCKLKKGSGAVSMLHCLQTRCSGKWLYHALKSVANAAIIRWSLC